jgi:hypothetical protein
MVARRAAAAENALISAHKRLTLNMALVRPLAVKAYHIALVAVDVKGERHSLFDAKVSFSAIFKHEIARNNVAFGENGVVKAQNRARHLVRKRQLKRFGIFVGIGAGQAVGRKSSLKLANTLVNEVCNVASRFHAAQLERSCAKVAAAEKGKFKRGIIGIEALVRIGRREGLRLLDVLDPLRALYRAVVEMYRVFAEKHLENVHGTLGFKGYSFPFSINVD